MADAALQALLDPDASGRGIQIIRRADADATTASYYVQANASAAGNINGAAQWVNVTAANTDEQKNTAIRLALGVP